MNEEQQFAFVRAAYDGELETLRSLLQDGVEVDWREPRLGDFPGHKGRTALWNAVRAGRSEIVRELLAVGARVDAHDARHDTLGRSRRKPKGTLLHTASRCRSGDVVDLLLKAGMEIEARDEYGCTPLHVAASNTRSGAPLARLLAVGADATATNQDGNQPLHEAQSVAAVEALLAAGADPNVAGAGGAPPLALLARAVGLEPEGLRLLVAAGADPNPVDGAPLTHAVGEPVKVEVLLAAGAQPTRAALAMACGAGEARSVDLLLEAGAEPCREAILAACKLDVTRATEVGRSLLDGRLECLQRLIRAGASADLFDAGAVLSKVAHAGLVGYTRTLVGAGAALESTDERGRTALWLAVEGDHVETAQVLLEAGADPDVVDRDGTRIGDAAEEACAYECVALLKRWGEKTNSK